MLRRVAINRRLDLSDAFESQTGPGRERNTGTMDDTNPNPSPHPNPHPHQVLLACLWVPTVPLFLVSFSLAFTIWTLAVGMIRAASLRVR